MEKIDCGLGISNMILFPDSGYMIKKIGRKRRMDRLRMMRRG